MNRAEEVKKLVQKWNTKGEICDKIHIIDGATGYSYRRVFGKYLKTDIKEIIIEEPYLKDHYQICDLVMFCELAVSTCQSLKYIRVTTIHEPHRQSTQFQCLSESLGKKNIKIAFDYSDNLHDRQVM